MPQPINVGYSGTPLAKKLGVKDNQRTWRWNMPATVALEIQRDGVRPALLEKIESGLEMAHIFVTRRSDLIEMLFQIRQALTPSGTVWVSWPKKSANVPTEVTEDGVRSEAFPLGLVDVKICAVDEVWSGLKLVIRKKERTETL